MCAPFQKIFPFYAERGIVVSYFFSFFIFCGKGKAKGTGSSRKQPCMRPLQKCDCWLGTNGYLPATARSARSSSTKSTTGSTTQRLLRFFVALLCYDLTSEYAPKIQFGYDWERNSACTCIWTLFNPKCIHFLQADEPAGPSVQICMAAQFLSTIHFCL